MPSLEHAYVIDRWIELQKLHVIFSPEDSDIWQKIPYAYRKVSYITSNEFKH